MSNNIWADSGLGGPLRAELHYNGRKMLCFSDRPPTLAEMLDDLVARFPERPAIVEDRVITYRELDGQVGKIAAGLRRLNVASGDRVALFLGNCWEFLACVLACNRLGAIVVPIGTRQRQAGLSFLLNDSEATVLIFESDLAEAVPGGVETPTVAHRLSVRGGAPDARPFSDLLEAGGRVGRAADLGEEDVAIICTRQEPPGGQREHS